MLTEKQARYVRLLAQGCTMREIAREMGVSVAAVRGYQAGVYREWWPVPGKRELLARARKEGVL